MNISEESDAPYNGIDEVDVFICAVGYESRSRWLFERSDIKAAVKIALRFSYSEGAAFSDNHAFFSSQQFKIIDSSQVGYDSLVIEEVAQQVPVFGSKTLSVMIDISVMSRLMLADMCILLRRLTESAPISLLTAYVPSDYTKPGEPHVLSVARPVRPEFAGWSSRPDLPLAAIIGLGYEEGLALGAMEYLNPSKVWAFVPVSDEPRFLSDVLKANEIVQKQFDSAFIQYALQKPIRLRSKLDELIRGVTGRFRIVIVPFGPKLFSWISMIVASTELGGKSRCGGLALTHRVLRLIAERAVRQFGAIAFYSNRTKLLHLQVERVIHSCRSALPRPLVLYEALARASYDNACAFDRPLRHRRHRMRVRHSAADGRAIR
jgi:hypothetical protein